MNEEQYVGKARADDPDGAFCGACGLTNYHAYDIGWFYVNGKPLCEVCHKKTGHQTAER